MDFQDEAFPPSRASFSTTFPKNCGRDKSLGTTTCLKTVVGGKHGHAPYKILWFRKSLILYQMNYMEIMRLSQRLGESGHPQFWKYYRV